MGMQRRGVLQLQQRQVGVAVVGLVGALLSDIFLENGRCLRVVSVQTIEDLVNVLRPLRRVVKCDAHGDDVMSSGGVVVVVMRAEEKETSKFHVPAEIGGSSRLSHFWRHHLHQPWDDAQRQSAPSSILRYWSYRKTCCDSLFQLSIAIFVGLKSVPHHSIHIQFPLPPWHPHQHRRPFSKPVHQALK